MAKEVCSLCSMDDVGQDFHDYHWQVVSNIAIKTIIIYYSIENI